MVTVDASGRISAWSPGAARLFGLAAGDAVGDHLWNLLPDDAHAERRMLRAVLRGEVADEVETRRPDAHGTPVPVTLGAHPLLDEDGEVTGAIVLFRGAVETGPTRAPAQGAEADARRLAAVVRSTQDAVITLDRHGRIAGWNPGAARLLGHGAPEVLGRPGAMLVPPDREGEDILLLSRVLAGETIEGHETQRVTRTGGLLDVALGLFPVHDAAGRIVEVCTVARDVSERRRAEEELRRCAADLEALARRDPLTGLLTLRELHGVLDRELARAAREGTCCSLLVLDVDGLREVNMARGRSAGDRLLRDLAAVVREACSPQDHACRIGGDELAVVLPGAGPGPALALAGRIRTAWRATANDATLSIGTSTWPEEVPDKEGLLRQACEAVRFDQPAAWEDGSGVDALAEPTAETDTAERIVALLRRHLGLEIACLTEFAGGRQVVRGIDAAPGARVRVEDQLPLERSYCRRMVDAELPSAIPDTRGHPVTGALDLTARAGMGTYVGVPVRLSDGRLYGSLFAAGPEARPDLDETAAQFAYVCARLVGDLLDQQELERENRRLQAEVTGVRALLAALAARDHYTGEHSEAVVALAAAVARRLRLSTEQLAEVKQVALLHDIGKIGIPDTVLQKPAPLDDEEWRLMRRHPDIGAQITASIPSLDHLAPAIRAEHERWDGCGYPEGLAGEEIPVASRIILACDAYHAMTSDRPYRRAMSVAAARRELEEGAGSQFDPRVVDALLETSCRAPGGRRAG